jgi:hypothetical protein
LILGLLTRERNAFTLNALPYPRTLERDAYGMTAFSEIDLFAKWVFTIQ